MFICCFNGVKDRENDNEINKLSLSSNDNILNLSEHDRIINISSLNKLNLLTINTRNRFMLMQTISNFQHNYKSSPFFMKKHSKRERIKREIRALREAHNNHSSKNFL